MNTGSAVDQLRDLGQISFCASVSLLVKGT